MRLNIFRAAFLVTSGSTAAVAAVPAEAGEWGVEDLLECQAEVTAGK